MTLLAIPFMYPAEINSQHMRNTGSAIAMLTNWLFVYVVVLMTPSGKSTRILDKEGIKINNSRHC
jgi:hypothetical protein